MTPTDCLEACRQLIRTHGFIVTEQAQVCRHEDGGVTVCSSYRITVFNGAEIVHATGDVYSFDAALASVREYLNSIKD